MLLPAALTTAELAAASTAGVFAADITAAAAAADVETNAALTVARSGMDSRQSMDCRRQSDAT